MYEIIYSANGHNHRLMIAAESQSAACHHVERVLGGEVLAIILRCRLENARN